MTDAKTYVDSRWGTRNRDERKRLMSAYEAGQKQEGKMTTERTPDYWDGWNDAVESIQNIALRAKVPSYSSPRAARTASRICRFRQDSLWGRVAEVSPWVWQT